MLLTAFRIHASNQQVRVHNTQDLRRVEYRTVGVLSTYLGYPSLTKSLSDAMGVSFKPRLYKAGLYRKTRNYRGVMSFWLCRPRRTREQWVAGVGGSLIFLRLDRHDGLIIILSRILHADTRCCCGRFSSCLLEWKRDVNESWLDGYLLVLRRSVWILFSDVLVGLKNCILRSRFFIFTLCFENVGELFSIK